MTPPHESSSPPSPETVASLANLVGGTIAGDRDRPISGVADVTEAGPQHIGFIRDARHATLAKDSRAGALFVVELLETEATQIVVEDAHAAFAKVALHFHPVPRATEHRIHPSAVVDASARLEEPVEVCAQAFVGKGAVVGAGTLIQQGAVVGEDVTLGRDCTIYPRVVIYPGVVIGDRVILHAGAVLGCDGFGYVIDKSGVRNKFPQLGTLRLGDDVEIGANTTIDRGALVESSIGNGTKLDNLCHIGHNCTVGRNCTISALSAFAAGTKLGDRVILAGHVMVAGVSGVSITDDVIIGGNSGVTHDIEKAGAYGGFPLLPRRINARTHVLRGRLVDLAAELKELKKRLDES